MKLNIILFASVFWFLSCVELSRSVRIESEFKNENELFQARDTSKIIQKTYLCGVIVPILPGWYYDSPGKFSIKSKNRSKCDSTSSSSKDIMITENYINDEQECEYEIRAPIQNDTIVKIELKSKMESIRIRKITTWNIDLVPWCY